jgi:hypothetical protein
MNSPLTSELMRTTRHDELMHEARRLRDIQALERHAAEQRPKARPSTRLARAVALLTAIITPR